VGGGCPTDVTDQPHLIIADGQSGAPEFGKSQIRAMMLNPAVEAADTTLIDKALSDYRGAAIVRDDTFAQGWTKLRTPFPVILWIHDQESQTLEELEYFVRREMSFHLRKVRQAKYQIVGHQIPDKSGNLPIVAIDSVYSVNDSVSQIDEPMWCMSRTLGKTRGATGSTSSVELARLHSIIQ
jgi:hypothetical protein